MKWANIHQHRTYGESSVEDQDSIPEKQISYPSIKAILLLMVAILQHDIANKKNPALRHFRPCIPSHVQRRHKRNNKARVVNLMCNCKSPFPPIPRFQKEKSLFLLLAH